MAVHISRWKKWFSYIMEIELERLESDHGHELSLCLSDGRFQLNAERAIYSWEDKYDNFYKAFDYIFRKNITYKPISAIFDTVLILGYGLGSIPQMLEKNFKKSFYYTGVELDDEVIYLAEKYCTHQLNSSVQMIQAPAEIFVQTCEDQYDLICVDVFINDHIPAAIKTHLFLESVHNLLSEKGIVLYNHLANSVSERKTAEVFFRNAFSNVFSSAELLDVDGNYIFIGMR